MSPRLMSSSVTRTTSTGSRPAVSEVRGGEADRRDGVDDVREENEADGAAHRAEGGVGHRRDHEGEGDDAAHAPGDVEGGDGDLPERLGLRERLEGGRKDGVPAEEDDAGDEAGDGDHDRGYQRQDAGDHELREEEAAARDRPDEEI